MTAIGVTTERVQIGSMVMAAAFRHPALLAKMAGALQELTGGRLLLGVGAGNQIAEHTALGSASRSACAASTSTYRFCTRCWPTRLSRCTAAFIS
jgi:alkanesulfonate monooxygenase SsuD/methylene tetrahydromethanopterin reductase-like flavin-dependent oxidoreductase (luciferase family)